MVSYMEMVGSLIEATTDENKDFYRGMRSRFRKFQKRLESV